MRLLERLLVEKDAKGLLYKETQILMAFHSGRLAGLQLEKNEVEEAFGKGGNSFLQGLFSLFDYMLETADDDLTESLIIRYHQVIVPGGGVYRDKDTVRDKVRGCIPSNEVASAMEELVKLPTGTIPRLAEHHYRYMMIDPFEQYSGIVGRMILYKECLRTDKVPIVVFEGGKSSAYSLGLAKYRERPERFIKMLRKMQDIYSKTIKSCPFGE